MHVAVYYVHIQVRIGAVQILWLIVYFTLTPLVVAKRLGLLIPSTPQIVLCGKFSCILGIKSSFAEYLFIGCYTKEKEIAVGL